MLHRLGRLVLVGIVILVIVYTVATRPGVAADALHGAWDVAGAALNAGADFLDALIPGDGGGG